MRGIDQNVSQTADAFRGNPQQLEQRYAASQDLVDLLALQRLKSEKEAAARDIQMQMAQNPATIKQQREQELAQMTKQEMVERVAPTMQRKMAQQQQAAQQAPQQAQEAQQGIAALQQQMQQRPTQQAASGGIMQAYAQGGKVQRFQEGGMPDYGDPDRARILRDRGYSEEDIAEILGGPQTRGPYGLGVNTVTGGAGATSEGGEAPQFIKDLAVSDAELEEERQAKLQGIRQNLGQNTPTATTQAPAEENQTQGGVPDDVDYLAAMEPTSEAAQRDPQTKTTTTSGQSGAPSFDISSVAEQQREIMGEIPEYEAYSIDDGLEDADKVFSELYGDVPTEQDAIASEEAAYERLLKRQEYTSRMDAYDKMLARREDMYERQNDPDRRRMQRISAFLRGFGNTSNLATGFSNASAARAQEVEKADARERAAMDDFYEVFQDREATRGQIIDKANTAALAGYKASMEERNTLLGKKGSVFNQQMQSGVQNAKAKYQAGYDKAKAKLDNVTNNAKMEVQKYAADLRANTAERMSDLEASKMMVSLVENLRNAEEGAKAALMAEMPNLKRLMDSPNEEERETAMKDFAYLLKSLESDSNLQYLQAIVDKMMGQLGYPVGDLQAQDDPEALFQGLGEDTSAQAAKYIQG